MATINEHGRIVLTKPVPNEGLEAGDVGTVFTSTATASRAKWSSRHWTDELRRS